MNTIKSSLCEGDNAKFYGIWVNTWQFSLLDSSPAPQAVVRILQSIVNQIIALKPDYERREQISQLIGAIATISSGLKSLSDSAGDPLFGVGKSTLSLAEKISNYMKKLFGTKLNNSQTDNAALVKQLSEEIQKLVNKVLADSDNKKSKEKDILQKYVPYNPFAISKISDCPCDKFIFFVYFCFCNLFSMIGFVVYYVVLMIVNIVGVVTGTIWSIVRALFDFCYYVIRIGYAICCKKEYPIKNNKRHGFIFFIDDLDRIEPNLALEIIEMLANVFNFKKCIFIFAVDENVLTKAVKLKLSKLEFNSDDIHCKREFRQNRYDVPNIRFIEFQKF